VKPNSEQIAIPELFPKMARHIFAAPVEMGSSRDRRSLFEKRDSLNLKDDLRSWGIKALQSHPNGEIFNCLNPVFIILFHCCLFLVK